MYSSKVQVLFIEDDPAYADLLRGALSADKKLVFDIVCVNSLKNALERLQQHSFDVVLADLFLPDSRGFVTFEEINKQCPSLPLVILTGVDNEEAALKAVQMGAQDYLIKGQVDARMFSRILRYAMERKRMEEALREREERQHLIIETANDAFIGMDANGVILDWNRQAELIFGWSYRDAIGKTVADTIIPPQHRKAHREGLKHFLASGEGPVLNRRVELTALHRDGHEFPVVLTVWPVHAGGSYRFNAYIHDITENRKLQQMKDEFVSTVSHELRTPMTIIREGVLQVLEGLHGDISQSQKKFLNMTLNGVDRLKLIIDGLLDISKLETGRVMLDKEPVDIIQLAREVNAAFLPRAQLKGIEIRENYPADGIRIYLDKGKILQVFTNLIDNALKFTDRGFIEVSIQDSPQSVECRVRDTGKGISGDNLIRVFSKFEQFGRKVGPGEKGTGLGLAITKGLVESHHGKIKVESRQGEGTQFIFSLPKFAVIEIFKEHLSRSLKAALKEKACLSVLLLEIRDYEAVFKKLGPERTEALLKELAHRLKDGLRQRVDTVLAGERRFYACLPATGKEAAGFVLKRIQQCFEEKIRQENLSDVVQISSKIASCPDDGDTSEEVMLLLHGTRTES